MVLSAHSDDDEARAEEAEPGEDGYWPALEILNERKRDYLVNWDGIDPETGRAWSPSWTRKSEVTEDLIEVWEAKKASKKKGGRRALNKSRKSRATPIPTSSKPADMSSKSSRTPPRSSGRAAGSPAISLVSDNGSPVSGEPFLGKRKRGNTRQIPADEGSKLMSKKQRIDASSPSASQQSPSRSRKRIERETIHEEEENEDFAETEDPGKASHSPSTSKVDTSNAILRIGPPRRRKKISRLPSTATRPSPHVPRPAPIHLREEEEENTQEAARVVSRLDSRPPSVKRKKRRLKPPSDAHPKLPVLAENGPPVLPSRDTTQEPQGPPDQEEPVEADPPRPEQDDEPAEPLPNFTPPGPARQQTPPDSPPRAKKNKKRLGPVPRLEPSHFKPYLPPANTASIIDEFSPKKLFPTQDAIESSIEDSQARLGPANPRQPSPDPEPVDDPLDIDIAPDVQDVQDTYINSDDQEVEDEAPDEERPVTDHDSTEQDPVRSQSPSGRVSAPDMVQLFNSPKLEDALMIMNQKSEEIEVLESRLAAQDAQIEYLQAENHRIQVECERLSVAHEVQREALEDAKDTVSELGVHIDYLQDSLDKNEAKVKELQGEVNRIQGVLDAKVEGHNLARVEWEEERTALEARLDSSENAPSQKTPTGWELEKKGLEDRLAELTEGRDELDRGKQNAENEVETWKEQYRKEFMRSQELRQEAKDAKSESSRVRGENAIIASQTKEAVRLVTMKYEAAIERLKIELGKAESLYKVLQAKDLDTGDNVRSRAISAVHLQEEVRRLRETLVSEVARKAARVAEVKRGKYRCHFIVDGVKCPQGFDLPQELWTHVIAGHLPSRGNDK